MLYVYIYNSLWKSWRSEFLIYESHTNWQNTKYQIWKAMQKARFDRFDLCFLPSVYVSLVTGFIDALGRIATAALLSVQH